MSHCIILFASLLLADVQTGYGKLVTIGSGVIDVPDQGPVYDAEPSWNPAIDSLFMALAHPKVADFAVAEEFAGLLPDPSLVCDLSAVLHEVSEQDWETLLFAASIAFLAGYQPPTVISADFIIWVVEHDAELCSLLREAGGIQWTPATALIPDPAACIIKPLRRPTSNGPEAGGREGQPAQTSMHELHAGMDDDDDDEDDDDDDDDFLFDDEVGDFDEDEDEYAIGARMRKRASWLSWSGFRLKSTITCIVAAIVLIVTSTICLQRKFAKRNARPPSLKIDAPMLSV